MPATRADRRCRCSLRRRFPFAAPAAVWVIAAALLVRRRPTRRVQRDLVGGRHDRGFPARQPARRHAGAPRPGGRASAALRSSSTTTPSTLRASSSSSRSLFAIGWLAGYALRERAAQAEEAEERALQAEREREAAARIAVAEERARIARELHDVVAHAVSVMVLQVGAVRHKLPEDAGRGQRRTAGRRAGRPLCARRDAPPARRDAPRRRGRGAGAPARASTASTPSLDEVGRAGLPVRLQVEGDAVPAPARDRSLRLPDRPGGPDQLAQARTREPCRRDRSLRPRRAAARGARRRRRCRDERRSRPRARRHPRTRQDLRRRDDCRHGSREAASSSARAFRSRAGGR